MGTRNHSFCQSLVNMCLYVQDSSSLWIVFSWLNCTAMWYFEKILELKMQEQGCGEIETLVHSWWECKIM